MSETKTFKERIEDFLQPARIYIQADGGDVAFKSFDEKTGVLTLYVYGHCISCSGYDQTFTFGIRTIILESFDEVKEVVFELNNPTF